MNPRDTQIIALAQNIIAAIRQAETVQNFDSDIVRQALGIANSVFESGEQQRIPMGIGAFQQKQASLAS